MSDSMIARVAGKLRLAIGRAILGATNDAPKLQELQIEAREGEVRDKVEHFQHYGYTSVPFPGCEGVVFAVGGSTDHLVGHGFDDRRYRPKGLEAGEVCAYTDEDGGEGLHRIHFKRGRVIELRAGPSTIVMSPEGIFLTGVIINRTADAITDTAGAINLNQG
ncbi:MAG: phage baseplate assembly protein [Burkholderiales bacterium]|nr:phage baseplate assembly protein [Burkholderiales bacterium]